MTRQEITGERDLSFSRWIRKNLPDSKTGFMVTDVDFFIYNYNTRKVAIVEVKTNKGRMRWWQENFYKNLDNWLKIGCKESNWHYVGFFAIRFENTCFDDGLCIINDKVVTEQEAIEILSLK